MLYVTDYLHREFLSVNYWKQIFIDYISDKKEQDSYTINFYDNNIIDEKLSYLFEWKNLIKDYKNRIKNYKH